jgi:putative transposase
VLAGHRRTAPAKSWRYFNLREREAMVILGQAFAVTACMPARPRLNVAEFIFHVFNRVIEGRLLLDLPTDFDVFCDIFRRTAHDYPVQILAYALMPTHWHLVLWPREDGSLSAFMHKLTMCHAKTWREMHESTGRGAVYQGRFKAVPIQRDGHLLRTLRYVERNPVRAGLVQRAEDWEWSSASRSASDWSRPALAGWPVERPAGWSELLNEPESPDALEEIRHAVRKELPIGNLLWSAVTSARLKWPVHGGRQGRPPARSQAVDSMGFGRSCEAAVYPRQCPPNTW